MDVDDVRLRRAWWLLLAAAVALKGFYLAEYLKLPFVDGPLFDSQVYLAQSDRVREGRFGDPTLLAFSPLYGYFLAALGARAGSVLPLVVQLALGLVNLLLLRRIAARLLGVPAALLAALFFTFYGPVLCFETKIMSETLGLTLALLALDRLTFARAHVQRQLPAAALAGALFALAILARASLVFCAPALAVAAFWPAPLAVDPRPARVRRALGFSLALALVLGAHGLWTRAQSGIFVPVILVSNTAAQATASDWTGDLSIFQKSPEQAVGAFSVVAQAEARLRRVQRGEPEPVAARPGLGGALGGWLRNLPGKTWRTLRDLETSFDYGFYGERSEVTALHLTGATFGMLLALAVFGAVFAFAQGRARHIVPLLALVLGILATTTLFHPSTRYRLPLVLALCPLAGFAWSSAFAITSRERRRWLVLGLAAVTLAFVVRGATRPIQHPGMWELRVAEAAAVAGDRALCEARLRRALALEPDDPSVQQRAGYVRALLPVPATP